MRAVAVLAVVLYHAGLEAVSGGFLGVDTFFVLSGYLITSLLVREWWNDGSISLPEFWRRRARRLLPALSGVLAGVLVVVALVRSELERFLSELPGVALHLSNWVLVAKEESYFEAMGRPSPLRHLWSLAVEGQFYLLWPIVVILALRTGGLRRVFVVAAAGTLASLALMALLYEPGGDPSRVYYGTDTHASGLLLGAAGAVMWPPGRTLTHRSRIVLGTVGMMALAGLTLSYLRSDEYSHVLYGGGIGLVSALSLLVVLSAADSVGPVASLLGSRALRWVGTRSYAIYLWHWPVMVFTRPGVDVPLSGVPAVLLQLVLVGGLAEMSYRYVEVRWRRASPLRGRHLERPSTPRRAVSLRLVVGSVAALGVVVLLGTPTSPPKAVLAAAALGPGSAREPLPVAADLSREPTHAFRAEPTLPSPSSTAVVEGPEPTATTTARVAEQLVVTAMGDSVMAGAVDELEAAYEGPIYVDADEGRTVPEGVALIEDRAEHGRLGDVVVVHLGNNGPIGVDDVRRVVAAAGAERRVIFITVRLPRRWEGRVNDTLREEVPKYPNVTLLDWHAASDGRRDWFAGDGLHVVFTPGADAYADLVADAVRATWMVAKDPRYGSPP